MRRSAQEHLHGVPSARKSSGRRRHHHHHHDDRRHGVGGVVVTTTPASGADVLDRFFTSRDAKVPSLVSTAPLTSIGPLITTAHAPAPARRVFGPFGPMGPIGEPAAFPFYGGAYGPVSPFFMPPFGDFYLR